jgi:hypothetical protein
MLTKLMVAAFVSCVALSWGTALAADTRSQVQAVYDAQCKAALAKDGEALQRTFSPDFVATDADGRWQTLSQIVALIKAPPAGWRVTACSFAIRNVAVENGMATVSVTRTVAGMIAQGIVSQPFAQIQDSTDIWDLKATPLETASTATAVRATLGDKVVDQRGTLSGSPAQK